MYISINSPRQFNAISGIIVTSLVLEARLTSSYRQIVYPVGRSPIACRLTAHRRLERGLCKLHEAELLDHYLSAGAQGIAALGGGEVSLLDSA